MSVESPSLFAQAIQEHLELKQQNSTLDNQMPLHGYKSEDPFENHPLFKTEEQARVEDTMDGAQSIVDEPTSLDWPTVEDTFANAPVFEDVAEDEQDQPEQSDENLWSKSRDFDWGD